MKLTEAMKKEILERVETGENYTSIAKDFGVSGSVVSEFARNKGIRKRNRKNSDGKVYPKCHRVGLKSEFVFCPYCAADIRTELEKLIELLERAEAGMHRPFDDASSRANYAILKAIAYLKEENK